MVIERDKSITAISNRIEDALKETFRKDQAVCLTGNFIFASFMIFWPLIPKFAGSNPAESVGFLKGDKNPLHAFLRKGSKIICPMSQI